MKVILFSVVFIVVMFTGFNVTTQPAVASYKAPHVIQHEKVTKRLTNHEKLLEGNMRLLINIDKGVDRLQLEIDGLCDKGCE